MLSIGGLKVEVSPSGEAVFRKSYTFVDEVFSFFMKIVYINRKTIKVNE